MKRTANTIGTRRTRTAKASQPFTNMLANTEHCLIFKGPGRKRPGFIFEKYLFFGIDIYIKVVYYKDNKKTHGARRTPTTDGRSRGGEARRGRITQEDKEMTTYRIYGKEIERWTHEDEHGRERTVQVEYEYKEYDETGDLIGTGTEDFSYDRMKKQLVTRFVYTWDGERRNKGGHRWFDFEGSILYNKKDGKEIKKHIERKYNAKLVQLRTA